MVLNFHTKTDVNGNTYFLQIDTEKKCFSRVCSRMVTYGVKVTKRDISNLIEDAKKAGYKEI